MVEGGEWVGGEKAVGRCWGREKYSIVPSYPTSFFFIVLTPMGQQLFIYTCACMFSERERDCIY